MNSNPEKENDNLDSIPSSDENSADAQTVESETAAPITDTNIEDLPEATLSEDVKPAETISEIDENIVEDAKPVDAGGKTRRKGKYFAPSKCKYLALCFGVPALIMLLVYVAMGVWPVEKNSVLVLDLNAQYVYYIEKFRSIIADGGSFLYTFERALGGEFLGIFAYYLASPFNLITLLFPKEYITEAILAILLLKCGFSGLTFGIYVHNTREKRRPAMTIMFSSMYALSAFAVIMQHNLMWTDNIICLPLIMLGIDRIIKYGKFKTFTLFLSIAILSNFYIGYMTCLFVAFYFFLRYFSLSRDERNPNGVKAHFPKSLLRVVVFSAIAVMISAVMIFSAYYSLTFGKLEFSTPDYEPKQTYDFINLLSKVFFGSYDTVRPSGMPHLYCGMLVPLLLPLFFVSPSVKPRKKICGGILLLIFAVSFTLSWADLLWHGFQRPNWLNARFAFIFVMIALLMCYDALAGLKALGTKKIIFTGCGTLLILIILQSMKLKNLPTFTAVWASIGIIAVYLAVVPFAAGSITQSGIKGWSIALVSITCVELFLSGVVNLYALDKDVSFSPRSSYRSVVDSYTDAKKLVSDDGFYRSEKTYHRRTNDNFAIGLRGLSNSTSTLNKSVIDLLENFGFTSKSHWSKYVGGTLTSDSIFGIKYIYVNQKNVDKKSDDQESDDQKNDEKTELPWYIANYYDLIGKTDEGIMVYKNPYALSAAFAVDDDFTDFDTTSVAPFDLMNSMYAAIYPNVEGTGELWKPLVAEQDYGGCKKFGVEQEHIGYEKTSDGVGYVSFEIIAESSDTIYMYVPSNWPREATLSINGREAGTYFTNETHAIKELGTFEPGESVTVKLRLNGEKLYMAKAESYFYYFDEALFDSIKDSLKAAELNISEHDEESLSGTIDVPEGQTTVLTTIPYDEGWRITVDGKEAEYDKSLGALISLKLTPGKHEITMIYRPECLRKGLMVTGAGIFLFAAACVAEAVVKHKRKKRSEDQLEFPVI